MVLGSLRLPPLVIELMYLIYRYIFLLLDIQHRMTVAASSRLGYASLRRAWFSFTHISGNLLAASFKRACAPRPRRPVPALPVYFQQPGSLSEAQGS